MIKKIWRDPVGSKVIAAGIITLIVTSGTWLKSILADQTFRQSFLSWWNGKVPISWILIVILVIIILWTTISSWKLRKVKNLKEELLKELRAIKAQLDNTHKQESADVFTKVKTATRYYHYEIIECFDQYNKIVEKLRQKWPNQYNELNILTERPKVPKGKLVYEDEMQIVKSNVVRLIEILK